MIYQGPSLISIKDMLVSDHFNMLKDVPSQPLKLDKANLNIWKFYALCPINIAPFAKKTQGLRKHQQSIN